MGSAGTKSGVIYPCGTVLCDDLTAAAGAEPRMTLLSLTVAAAPSPSEPAVALVLTVVLLCAVVTDMNRIATATRAWTGLRHAHVQVLGISGKRGPTRRLDTNTAVGAA